MENFALDKSFWKLNDSDWMENRKSKWKIIEKQLEHVKPRKGITAIKRYFLKGQLPDWDKMEDWGDAQGHVDIFVLLWLHPSWDRNVLITLRDEYLSFVKVRLDDVAYGYGLFLNSGVTRACCNYYPVYNYHEDIPAVETEGHNELLFDILMEDSDRETIQLARVEFEAKIHPVFHYPKPNLSALYSVGEWLSIERMFPINQDMLLQYDSPLEWWYQGCACDRSFLKGPQLEAKLANFAEALRCVYNFDTDKEGDSPRSRFVEKMRIMLDERPFIKEIEDIWLRVKKGG